MNCNRRVVVKNPPTQGSSRCVCLTIHTDKYYFLMNLSNHLEYTLQRSAVKPSLLWHRFINQGQSRCINNSDLCSPRLEAWQWDKLCTLSGHPSRAVAGHVYALMRFCNHTKHNTHNTTLCGYRSTTQLRKTVQSTHMSVCTHYMNTRRIIGFAVDHLKYSRLLTRLHCRWQRGMPLGYIGSHVWGSWCLWESNHQQHTWDVT